MSADAGPRLPRRLWLAIRRDPQHLPEHLVLVAHERLAGPAHAWAAEHRAADPETGVARLSESTRTSAARLARVNGAISGTPFLIALVPAYVSVLWEQARMVMRIAALNGRDPREPAFAAELLVLRGLYTSAEPARRHLAAVAAGTTVEGEAETGRLRSWIRLVHRVLILAGFLSAPDPTAAKPGWLRQGVSMLVGLGLYAVTWIFPVTFMLAMSWGCETDTRALGERAMAYYGGKTALTRAPRRRPSPGHVAVLVISLFIPLGIMAFAVSDPVAHARAYALSAFIGLTVAIALSARAGRR